MRIILVVFALFTLAACNDDPTARPIGYMRIDLPFSDSTTALEPEHCGFELAYNTKAVWRYKDTANCYIDLLYPSIMSTVQLTYKPVEENLEELVIDAQKLAYKHTVKASGMRERFFSYPEKKVHGMYYEMSGASATTTQFYATDSANHFLRGVLYHYSSPNPDSLAPVTQFMREEIQTLISTLAWNEEQ
jgi:gliding motility-associated lipoprotein GldD